MTHLAAGEHDTGRPRQTQVASQFDCCDAAQFAKVTDFILCS